jgi:hypothetical protein
MKHVLKAALTGLAILAAPMADAQRQAPPVEWDGLQRMANSGRFNTAWLLPGADFSGFSRKVIIDPTEAAFRNNWQRDFNRTRSLSQRISDNEARDMLNMVQTGFQQAIVQAYRDAGYQIVTQPAPDVLRIRTAVFNIDVAAPGQMSAARTRTYTTQAGQASLMIEAKDSMSNAVLARGIDARNVGTSGFMVRRTRGSNRADFRRQFAQWAQMSVDGLAALKAMPPPVAVAQN